MFIDGLGLDLTSILDAGTKIAASAQQIDAAKKAADTAKAQAASAAQIAMYNAQAADAQARIAANKPVVTTKYATPIKIGLGVVAAGLTVYLVRRIMRRRRARR